MTRGDRAMAFFDGFDGGDLDRGVYAADRRLHWLVPEPAVDYVRGP